MIPDHLKKRFNRYGTTFAGKSISCFRRFQSRSFFIRLEFACKQCYFPMKYNRRNHVMSNLRENAEASATTFCMSFSPQHKGVVNGCDHHSQAFA